MRAASRCLVRAAIGIAAVLPCPAQEAKDSRPQPAASQASETRPESRPAVFLRVRGRVLDEAGQAIVAAGITVGAWPDLIARDALEHPLAHTDAEGRFAVELKYLPADAPMTENGLLLAARGKATMRWSAQFASYRSQAPFAQALPSQTFDLGTVKMSAGVDVRGRIRSTDGKGLGGARVLACETSRFGDAPEWTQVSTAVTGPDGAFVLPGTALPAATICVQADGHFDRVLPAHLPQEPLVVELQPSGWFAGRVLDEKDQPVRAVVAMETEAGEDIGRLQGLRRCAGPWAGWIDAQGCATSDAQGRFRLTQRYPGMCRLHVHPAAAPFTVATAVQTAPSQDLVLRVACALRVTFQVVEHKTGKPIQNVAAAMMWDTPSVSADPTQLPWCFQRTAQHADPQGRIRLWTPPEVATSAIYRLDAPGMGSIAVGWISWDGVAEPHYELRLAAESAVVGRVVDEDSGAPLPGALVRCRTTHPTLGTLWCFDNPDAVVGTAVSDAEGRFRIGGLGVGDYDVDAVVEGRPAGELHPVALGLEETRSVDLPLPKGATLTGHFTGGALPVGAWLELAEEIATPPGRGSSWFRPVPRPVLLTGGAFRTAALAQGRYRLTLRFPVAGGPALSVELPDLVHMPAKDSEQTFDTKALLPATIAGKVSASERVPAGRLALLLVPDEGMPSMRHPLHTLGADGSFTLQVVPGTYRPFVLDPVSGASLWRGETQLELRGGTTTPFQLSLPLVRVEARLVGRGEEAVFAQALVVDTPVEALSTWGHPRQMFLADGTREATLFLPPGNNTLQAVLGFGAGGMDKLTILRAPVPFDFVLGELALHLDVGSTVKATLTLEPRPEVPENLLGKGR